MQDILPPLHISVTNICNHIQLISQYQPIYLNFLAQGYWHHHQPQKPQYQSGPNVSCESKNQAPVSFHLWITNKNGGSIILKNQFIPRLSVSLENFLTYFTRDNDNIFSCEQIACL